MVKNLEGKPKKENPNRTITVSREFGSLQMVSELDTRRCASKEAEPRRGDTRQYASKDTRSQRGWIGGLTLIEEGNECKRERWSQRGGLCRLGRRIIKVWKSLPSKCILKI